MIYQLYPNNNINCLPFNEYYSTLCLDCLDKEYLPELKMEYSGMLYLWKNNIDNDNWIGFTSHRQFTKSNFLLTKDNYDRVIGLLNSYDILCWLYHEFNFSVSIQADTCHPKINSHIYLLLRFFNEEVPISYYTHNCGCYANYWIMSKQNFNEFMEWSYPKVLKILDLSKSYSYYKIDQHLSNGGYIIERLYIIWYLLKNKSISNLQKEIL